MFIYKIVNKINGKIYVGKTTSFNLHRYLWTQLWRASRGEKGKPFLYNAIRKYGKENFEIVPLLELESLQDLNLNEIRLIQELRSRDRKIGYNIAPGGEGNTKGLPSWNSGKKNPYSKETIRKMTLSQRKRAIEGRFKGHPMSAECRQKISETLKKKGIKPSIEACRLGGKVTQGAR